MLYEMNRSRFEQQYVLGKISELEKKAADIDRDDDPGSFCELFYIGFGLMKNGERLSSWIVSSGDDAGAFHFLTRVLAGDAGFREARQAFNATKWNDFIHVLGRPVKDQDEPFYFSILSKKAIVAAPVFAYFVAVFNACHRIRERIEADVKKRERLVASSILSRVGKRTS